MVASDKGREDRREERDRGRRRLEECRLETTDMVIARFIASLRFVSSSCSEREAHDSRRGLRTRRRARFPPELTSALSFLSLPLSPREIVIVRRLDSPASFLHSRPRLLCSIVTASIFLDRRRAGRRDSSSDCPYTNYILRNGTINVLSCKWKCCVVSSTAECARQFLIRICDILWLATEH